MVRRNRDGDGPDLNIFSMMFDASNLTFVLKLDIHSPDKYRKPAGNCRGECMTKKWAVKVVELWLEVLEKHFGMCLLLVYDMF